MSRASVAMRGLRWTVGMQFGSVQVSRMRCMHLAGHRVTKNPQVRSQGFVSRMRGGENSCEAVYPCALPPAGTENFSNKKSACMTLRSCARLRRDCDAMQHCVDTAGQVRTRPAGFFRSGDAGRQRQPSGWRSTTATAC